jgi:hypothetical protein
MKLNLFKRTSEHERLTEKIAEHQVTLSKAVRQEREELNQRFRKQRVFMWDGIECVIERLDFSGGDNTHYALILLKSVSSAGRIHLTVPVGLLHPTAEFVDAREWWTDDDKLSNQ